MCSDEPTHPGGEGGQEQGSDLSLRTGLGLAECIPAVFTAKTDPQQNEVSSSAGASAGDSSFCSQQLLLPAAGLEGDVGPHPGQGYSENSLQASNVCPGRESDPFMNHLGKGVRIVLIACCRGVKKVLAFPVEGL